MISKRQRCLLEWVKGPVLADIGCDHAQLCTSAVLSGKVKKAYACDVAQGPLQRAKDTIAKAGTDKVIPILSDGLANVPADVDQIVIAGLGGETIIGILSKGLETAKGCSLLLSPHSKAELVRRWLQNNGFEIRRERMVEDAGRYYPVIEAYAGQMSLSDLECQYGSKVVKDEDWKAWMAYEIRRLESLLNCVPDQAGVKQALEYIKKSS